MKRARLLATRMLFGAVLGASGALASRDYPHDLAVALHLPGDPPCTLCHRDSNGGAGTVVQPFGKAMQSFGLHSGDPPSLSAAIQRSREARWDSDGDGAPDVAELTAGKDPNDPADGPPKSEDAGTDAGPSIVTSTLVPEPEHGCSVSSAAGGRDGTWLLETMALMLMVWRRARRRRRAAVVLMVAILLPACGKRGPRAVNGSGGANPASSVAATAGAPPTTAERVLETNRGAACLACAHRNCQATLVTDPAALAILDCVLPKSGQSCALNQGADCYCGTAVGAVCLGGDGPDGKKGVANGVCKAQQERGLQSTSPGFIATHYVDPALPGGPANALVLCLSLSWTEKGDRDCGTCFR